MTTYTTDGSTIQTVTILTSGTYDIIADGAQGGTGNFNPDNGAGRASNPGGDGASVSGDIYLQAGTTLELVVGTEGGHSVRGGGGGGGGSFVIELPNGSETVDTILAVAGGGGGGGWFVNGTGGAGQAGSSGGHGTGNRGGGAGGSPGQPGSGGSSGGGGGGFTGGNGAPFHKVGSPGSVGGTTFQGGPGYTFGTGGFGGGGGGGFSGGGGGGGYGGGGGGGIVGTSGGGGGGSYLNPLLTDQVRQAGVNAGPGSISITPLCYLRGTHILTPGGEVLVEDLRIGDTVCTVGRGPQPIRWIGTGTLMVPAGHRSPATPVIVRRDALAPGVPHRDLHITKGHALYLEGLLIPAEFLVNHRSIVWNDAAREVEYYHIELDAHDVLLAEGAPTESYRDEGNRWMFRNANPAWDQPGVAPFAPVLTGGPAVDAVWAALLNRAGLPPRVPTTTDPDLHLLVDGVRVDGVQTEDGVFVFPLPEAADSITIASRAAAQDELGRCRDPRRLGVAISRVELCCGGAGRLDLPAAALTGPGFHAYEPQERCTWTDGHAALPQVATGVEAECLRLHLRHTTHYPAEVRRAA